jgi:hypothetical protein
MMNLDTPHSLDNSSSSSDNNNMMPANNNTSRDDDTDHPLNENENTTENANENSTSTDDALSTTDVTPMNTDDESIASSSSIINTQHHSSRDTKGRRRRYRCRICLSTKQNNKTKQLIQPCLCKGSMKFVHLTCLHMWRQTTKVPLNHYRCENCLHYYTHGQVAIKSSTLDHYITHPHIFADLPDQQYKLLQLQISHRKKQLLISNSASHRKLLRQLRANESTFHQTIAVLHILRSLFYSFLPKDMVLPLLMVSCCLFIEYRFVHHYDLLISFYYTIQYSILSLLIVPLVSGIRHVARVVFQVESDWWHNDC